jgi:hypothetical protein
MLTMRFKRISILPRANISMAILPWQLCYKIFAQKAFYRPKMRKNLNFLSQSRSAIWRRYVCSYLHLILYTFSLPNDELHMQEALQRPVEIEVECGA